MAQRGTGMDTIINTHRILPAALLASFENKVRCIFLKCIGGNGNDIYAYAVCVLGESAANIMAKWCKFSRAVAMDLKWYVIGLVVQLVFLSAMHKKGMCVEQMSRQKWHLQMKLTSSASKFLYILGILEKCPSASYYIAGFFLEECLCVSIHAQFTQ